MRCPRVHVLARHPLRLDDEGGVACGNLALGLVCGNLRHDALPAPPVARSVIDIDERAVTREDEAAARPAGTSQEERKKHVL